MTEKGTKVIGSSIAVVVLGVGLFFGIPEKSSESLTRTQKYLKLVGEVQKDQDKLTTFIEGEQKTCQAKGNALQLSPQGILQCVEGPKAAQAPAVLPAAPKK